DAEGADTCLARPARSDARDARGWLFRGEAGGGDAQRRPVAGGRVIAKPCCVHERKLADRFARRRASVLSLPRAPPGEMRERLRTPEADLLAEGSGRILHLGKDFEPPF